MQIDQLLVRDQVDTFLDRLPILSITVARVTDVCGRDDATAEDLGAVIAEDQALSARVLKLVNSAHYSLVSDVTSLTRAVMMLGFNTIRNMALTGAVIRAISAIESDHPLPADTFWTHSLNAAAGAKLLARAGGAGPTELEQYLVVGLLHDLGKLAFADEYRHVLEFADRSQITLIEAERELLGLDHQQVGARIAARWQFEELLTTCIGCHHEPGEADERYRLSTVLTALGDFYANIYDRGYAGNRYPAEADLEELLEMGGLDLRRFAAIGADIDAEILRTRVYFQI